jgi:hypothetical protein
MPNEHAHIPNFLELEDGWRLSGVDDRASVYIGKKDTGKPFIRSEKWNNPHPRFPGCWLEMSVPGAEVSPNNKPDIVRGNRFGQDRETLQAEVGHRGKTHYHEWYIGNSLDWDVVFPDLASMSELIDGNGDYVIDFDLTYPEGLTFSHQDHPTQADIDEGVIRPDNIRNSFAAYFNQAGRFMSSDGGEYVNYETGKYGHLYRPVMITNDQSERWAEQWLVNPTTLRVKMEGDWIRSLGQAQWPLRLDPTFGYTTIGGSLSTTSLRRCLVASATTHTAATGDTITGFSLYGSTTSASPETIDVAPYEISGTLPGNRLGSNQQITLATSSSDQWNSVTGLSLVMTNGIKYGPAFQGSSSRRKWFDVGTGDEHSNGGSGTLPATWSHGSYSTAKYSIYATYTVAPTGTLLKHPGMDGGMNRNMNAGMRG